MCERGVALSGSLLGLTTVSLNCLKRLPWRRTARDKRTWQEDSVSDTQDMEDMDFPEPVSEPGLSIEPDNGEANISSRSLRQEISPQQDRLRSSRCSMLFTCFCWTTGYILVQARTDGSSTEPRMFMGVISLQDDICQKYSCHES